MSCSILIVNRAIVSPTLNVNPAWFVIPCKNFWGLWIYSVAITVTYQVISIIHDNISSQVADKSRKFWPFDELVHMHDNICSLVHKKCLPKSYPSDSKYHISCSFPTTPTADAHARKWPLLKTNTNIYKLKPTWWPRAKQFLRHCPDLSFWPMSWRGMSFPTPTIGGCGKKLIPTGLLPNHRNLRLGRLIQNLWPAFHVIWSWQINLHSNQDFSPSPLVGAVGERELSYTSAPLYHTTSKRFVAGSSQTILNILIRGLWS